MMVAGGAPVPIKFIVLNAIAFLFFAAGIVGLLMPGVVPLVAAPLVAWSLIGIGAIMDGVAVVYLVAGRKKRTGARQRATVTR